MEVSTANLKSVEYWKKWEDDNKVIITRFLEPHMSSYKKSPTLVINDLKV